MQTPPSFFEGISAEAVEAALAGLERRRFPAGAVIVAEGDYLEEMYVLRAGTADVVLVDRKGAEHVLSTVPPGEPIGEMSLLTGSAASATVRARDDVELLVLQSADLEALLDALPQLQRNIIATLSARLVRVSKLALHEAPGRLIILEDAGGPDLLGFALAASVAWHTRSSTLHIFLGATATPQLAGLATVSPEPPFRGARTAGAELMTADGDGHFGPDQIETTLNELTRTYDHILLQLPTASTRRLRGDRRLRVVSVDSPNGSFAFEPRAGGREQVMRIPALTTEDLASLEQGLLPTSSAAGIAVGAVARELAYLKVGIALGAGSIRGYAHVGALRAFERHGIPVDCLAGTSIGATVAAAYARFGDVDRAGEFLDGLGASMFRPTVSRKSLLSAGAMRRYARKAFGDPLLEELPIPVAVVATDVNTQDEVVLRRGSTVAALFASAAVPGVYPAVRIGNRTLVDGGIVNPVPASVAASLGADVVIGVRLVHPGGVQADEVSEEGEGPIPSAVAAIMRSIEFLQTRIGMETGSVPTILVTPEFGSLPAGKLRHFRDGRCYVAAGEAAVDAALPRLSAVLPWLRPIDVDSKQLVAAPR
jgi:NTE family protein